MQCRFKATKVGDTFKFVADFTRMEITVFHNDKSLGVVWKNIFDELVPAASTNNSAAEYTICGEAF